MQTPEPTINGFPNGEPGISPARIAELMGWSRQKAWKALEDERIKSLVTDVTARGVERRTCKTWLQEYMNSLNKDPKQ